MYRVVHKFWLYFGFAGVFSLTAISVMFFVSNTYEGNYAIINQKTSDSVFNKLYDHTPYIMTIHHTQYIHVCRNC